MSPKGLFLARLAGACATLLMVGAVASAAPVAPLANFTLVNHISSLSLVVNSGTPTNFSDITYNTDTGTLFIIDNGNQDIYEYSTAGAPLRRITGTGFLDTEGIDYLGANKFAVLEEGVKDISIVTIGPATTAITKGVGTTTITPSAPAGNLGNTGFEGVAYNAALNVYYLVKEMSSRQVYQVAANGTATLMTAVTSAVTTNGATDMGGVYFDESPGGHLYILSQQSNRLLEITLGGTLIATMPIPGTQVEGVAFSPDGLDMYVIGEARDFYHYHATPVPEPAMLTLGALGGLSLLGMAWRRKRSA
jgi:uncharacterized protein YjiK